MNAKFNVTWQRMSAGESNRHGMLDRDLSLREALQAVRNEPPSMSESRGSCASDSRHTSARWFSVDVECWESGDKLTLSIHFPETATDASRARLCRFLARVM